MRVAADGVGVPIECDGDGTATGGCDGVTRGAGDADATALGVTLPFAALANGSVAGCGNAVAGDVANGDGAGAWDGPLSRPGVHASDGALGVTAGPVAAAAGVVDGLGGAAGEGEETGGFTAGLSAPPPTVGALRPGTGAGGGAVEGMGGMLNVAVGRAAGAAAADGVVDAALEGWAGGPRGAGGEDAAAAAAAAALDCAAATALGCGGISDRGAPGKGVGGPIGPALLDGSSASLALGTLTTRAPGGAGPGGRGGLDPNGAASPPPDVPLGTGARRGMGGAGGRDEGIGGMPPPPPPPPLLPPPVDVLALGRAAGAGCRGRIVVGTAGAPLSPSSSKSSSVSSATAGMNSRLLCSHKRRHRGATGSAGR